ncbi:endo-1,4-beta-xylanase [Gracilibacillus alcaliphilus]|uniref:endo-1,4-beta-xylanase n=1 Tax=Gracilibacillus alcaliphilus TaxID=1401441 RepID=UPI00195661C8|nr:endo-1,4-beta-xylanase [Gracilibacillus alcaliphilus]MBM7677699.1 endo-1,4-beta-xylanase [Gracilibacillus alcaliphilus]
MSKTKIIDHKSIAELFADDFLIGAAVSPLTIQKQRDLLTHHFNSITAENEMKFERVHPEENEYTFEKADQIVEFAKNNNLGVRGHTLIWHNQTTDWIFQNQDGSEISRQQLLERMQTHIKTVMQRYKGQIYAWDVVNEAISDKENEFLRPSKWLEIVGDDFIAEAFRLAHAVEPNAALFYNDYNEVIPEKRDKIYHLVQSLLNDGVPIHGIGLQGHWNIQTPEIDWIRAAIEKYASLGLELHITELDLSVFTHDDKRTDLKEPTEEMLALQAKRYKDIFSLFKEYRNYITSVTFWGGADDYTWLDNFPVRGRKNWPFLFDQYHQPKRSYWELADLCMQQGRGGN